MSKLDQLKIIQGSVVEHRFLMRSVAGFSVNAFYKAEGLRSWARLIQAGEPLTLYDGDKTIFVPIEMNEDLKRELLWIADELPEEE